jgi:hypothetical protein
MPYVMPKLHPSRFYSMSAKQKSKKAEKYPFSSKSTSTGAGSSSIFKQSVNPNDWDTGKGRVAGRTDQAKLVNNFIEAIRVQGSPEVQRAHSAQ